MKKRKKVIIGIIVVLLIGIITTITIYFIKKSKVRDSELIAEDIEVLESKVEMYYAENKTLPIKMIYYGNILSGMNEDDDEVYYVIDIDKLGDISLNYGKDFKKLETIADTVEYTDLYIITQNSGNIYYMQEATE